MVSCTATSRWPSRFAYLSATIFIGASASVNLIYGIGKGSDLPSSIVWGAVSVAASVTFALSWPSLIRAAGNKSLSGVLIAFVALLLSGAYSISAALGSAGAGRMDAASTETTAAAARQRAQARYDGAQVELEKIAHARPVAEIEALITAAPQRCRVEVTTGSRQTVCTKPPALLAELARSRQRERLQDAADKASETLANAHTPKTANADARVLARYLGATPKTTLADAQNDAANASVLAVQTQRLERSRVSGLEEWLRLQGGKAHVGMRGLGVVLGCSPSKAHDQVRRLASAGVVRAIPGSRGTMLELTTRPN